MEFGSIERELRIDAAIETVFDVISNPVHIADWWSAQVSIEPVPGSDGELVFVDEATGRRDVIRITVAEAQPPRLFAFRWTHPEGADDPALHVRFELTPDGDGTLLRMTETGFREKGWEAAVLEEQYQDHVEGWRQLFPRIRALAEGRAG